MFYQLLHLGDAQNGKDQTFYRDGNVVSMHEEGEESFYLQDDPGSLMEPLNAEGGIRESYAFDEFGVPLVERLWQSANTHVKTALIRGYKGEILLQISEKNIVSAVFLRPKRS